jgi:hypothetical protein
MNRRSVVASLLAIVLAPLGLQLPERRSFPVRGKVRFNVRDYGAVGDYVTDDTAAFRAAIKDARAANDMAFVPAGKYLITGSLV